MLKCSRCQSENVIPNVRIVDQAGNYIRLGVNVYEYPDALVFKGKHSSALRSQVCGECGCVESFVENPQELYAAYLKSAPPQELVLLRAAQGQETPPEQLVRAGSDENLS